MYTRSMKIKHRITNEREAVSCWTRETIQVPWSSLWLCLLGGYIPIYSLHHHPLLQFSVLMYFFVNMAFQPWDQHPLPFDRNLCFKAFNVFLCDLVSVGPAVTKSVRFNQNRRTLRNLCWTRCPFPLFQWHFNPSCSWKLSHFKSPGLVF